MPGAARADSSFLLTTTDPTYRNPAFLGNGAFSLVGSPLGTTPAHSFAAGVYDRAPGDVPRLALLPVWNAFDISVGDARLNDATTDPSVLRSYRQTLDMHDGTLTTTYDWAHGATSTSVEITAFVSRADPELAVLRLRLVPRNSGRMTVRFALHEWPPPKRKPLARLERLDPPATEATRLETLDPATTQATLWYPGHVTVTARDATAITARVEGGTTTVAVAQSVLSRELTVPEGADEVSFDASPGVPITFTKIVSVVTERDGSDPLPRARAAVRRASAAGYDTLLAEHTTAWHRLWETDVVVEGDPELQRVVHAMLFYLLSSIREGSDDSIPAMGLSSAGYHGHVFWDADTWMFPALAVLHPAIARSIVAFRSRTLGAAQRNARANGHRGAQYPWEADERGEEVTPRFALQNALREIHVSGDVAHAQWQYYLATGDRTWLEDEAYPVIKETADFWVGRAQHDAAADRYDIRDVVSVDEDQIGVANDAYTNAVARKNLEIALAASRLLGRTPDPQWARVAAGLHIPYDASGDYHHTYEGASPETRGSVAPLLTYPLAVPMSERTKRNDLAHAVERLKTHSGGAMMTLTLYPVVAAELGDRALVDHLLPRSYEAHLRAPFHAIAETPNSDAINFVTGAGAFLQQFVFGYTGLRLGDDGLSPAFRPVLPSRIRRLVLRNASIRGQKHDIVVEGGTTLLAPRAAERERLSH